MAKRFVKFVVERFVAKATTKKLESKSKNYQSTSKLDLYILAYI